MKSTAALALGGFAALCGLGGCNDDVASPSAPSLAASNVLRDARAHFVKENADALAATAGSAGSGSLRAETTVRLGSNAKAGFALGHGGTLAHVRLEGARDAAAEIIDGTTIYRDAYERGHVLQRVSERGTEDYVLFTERPTEERLRYRVGLEQGIAGLRAQGGTLELLDASGDPQMRIEAPYALDDRGDRVPVTMTVQGCAVDTDARPPWGRPVTAPGASECFVDVTWSNARYPLLVDPAWSAASFLPAGFTFLCEHTPTLGSGNVLAIAAGASASQVWNPATGNWAATGATGSIATQYAACHTLSDGRAFLVGGFNAAFASQREARTYSEAAGVWTAAPSAPAGANINLGGGGFIHANVTARDTVSGGSIGLRLADGRILFAGGEAPAPALVVYSGVYAFNPTTNRWSGDGVAPSLASMSGERRLFSLIDLGDGRIMAAGGVGNDVCTAGLSTTEIYNLATNTWTPGPALTAGTFIWGSSIRRSDGKFLIKSGGECDTTAKVAILDPATMTWSAMATAPHAGRLPNVRPSWLRRGDTLLSIDDNVGTNVMRSVLGGAWTVDTSLPAAGRIASFVGLNDGRLLVVQNSGATRTYGCSSDSECSAADMCQVAIGICVARPVIGGSDGGTDGGPGSSGGPGAIDGGAIDGGAADMPDAASSETPDASCEAQCSANGRANDANDANDAGAPVTPSATTPAPPSPCCAASSSSISSESGCSVSSPRATPGGIGSLMLALSTLVLRAAGRRRSKTNREGNVVRA